METSLKTAVYTALSGALTVDVHNGAPLDAALPYVDLDEYIADDWSSKTTIGEMGELRIHVWTKGTASVSASDECASIMEQIKTALNRVELTLVGHNFVDCQYKTRRSFTDADGLTRHGIVDFEVLAQE